ncbi:MAG: acetylornithine aminotransferase [Nitrospirae bacterium RBG_16_64_22]|nr:MAG: acetylornithine aminotransferase [Nitrospirae bacterium RBG_16_64_22]
MSNRRIIEESERVLMPTYGRFPVALVRGRGCRVWDADGKEYLDFLSGVAVCALGHAHPEITSAIREQAGQLVHVSNYFHIEPQVRLARLLVDHSFADRVFFCNSGAEANEGAIKLARKYAKERIDPGRFEIIAMAGSFHGRTLAALTATGQEKVKAGFDPLPPGFVHVPFDDAAALEAAVTEKTAAVLIEPIQGESGVRIPSDGFLAAARGVCDRHGILLILDEIQTGIGRTGTLFAYEQCGIVPDIMTLAKGLGNGVPIGALLATEKIAQAFGPGSHGSTFGGNPLACAAAAATLSVILRDGPRGETLLDNALRMGAHLLAGLNAIRAKHPDVTDVRGRGLMIGIELNRDAKPVVDEALSRGLIANAAAGNVVRLLPPLIVTEAEADEAIEILDAALLRASVPSATAC